MLKITPWHNVYWYTDSTAFQQGIDAIEHAYRQKGIDDYVIVKFYLPDHSTPDERRAVSQARIADILNVAEATLADSVSNIAIPVYEYVAYTAVQMLPKSKCLQIISCDKDIMEEVQELLPSMEENDALCYLHECVESIEPSPQCDSYEIGYPAKFNKFCELPNCTSLGVIRHGIFSRNTVLTDKIIYAELGGEDGSTGQKLKKTVDMRNLAHVQNLKEDIATVLETNPVWRNHILQIIEDLGAQYRSYRSDLSNDAPTTNIFTLRDGKWRPHKTFSLMGLFNAYVEKNQTLVDQIFIKIHSHDKGTLFDFQSADIALEKYVDMATAKKRNLYYADAPSVCDICKFPLSDAKFMVDGAVRGSLSWANMCGDCFFTYGVKIGWGYGQLYKREAGKWLLVGGFCPNPEQQP